MAQVIKDIVNWLKQWFYTESEVDTLIGGLQTQINNKADTSTVNSLSTTVSNKADKTNGASQITDSNASNYSNISQSLTNASTQADINSAINTKIGTLMDLDWIVIVQTLPTASASTMGKLYLVAIIGDSDNNFAEYVTVEQNSSYSWEKLGEISGSGLSVAWNDITGKPSSFTPSSHTHGQITNDGKITSSAVAVGSGDCIVITDSSDSNKIKKTTSLLDRSIEMTNAQGSPVNVDLYTAFNDLSDNKANKTQALGTTITLVDKGETNEGCIIFNTIS